MIIKQDFKKQRKCQDLYRKNVESPTSDVPYCGGGFLLF